MTWQKRGKYGSKHVWVVGQTIFESKAIAISFTGKEGEHFHSKAEAKEYLMLKKQEELGLISDLRRQVKFKLYGMGGTLIGVYTVDYAYKEGSGDSLLNVAHESKAKGDTAFEIRVKLFKDNYPGWVFRITGAYQRIKDKANTKARMKYAEKKMLLAMAAEKE